MYSPGELQMWWLTGTVPQGSSRKQAFELSYTVLPFLAREPGPITRDIHADSYKSISISACWIKRCSADPSGAPRTRGTLVVGCSASSGSHHPAEASWNYSLYSLFAPELFTVSLASLLGRHCRSGSEQWESQTVAWCSSYPTIPVHNLFSQMPMDIFFELDMCAM